MRPAQKRVVTLICCQGVEVDEALAARILDSHRRGKLAGVARQEIIDYAHERCGLSRARLNAEMAGDEPDRLRPGQYPEATNEPCNDCPWRRNAARGWLGPYDADTWLAAAHGEDPIACHKTIPEGGGWGPRTLQCRGAATFRANVCKSPRDPSIAVGPSDAENVFATNDEFKDHHDKTSSP